MKRHNKDGSVLILAFWVLFFLAALTVASAGHVWAVLQAAERLITRAVERQEACSAAAWAVGNVEKIIQNAPTNHWDGLAQGAWNRSVEIYTQSKLSNQSESEGYVYFLSPVDQEPLTGVISEEGRLDLNEGLNERLIALFTYLGGASGREIATSIFQDQNESEGGLTAGQKAGYDSFASVEDLLFVDGMDTALFARVAPHVTVYSKGNIINANAASHAVWTAFLLSTGNKDVVADAEAIATDIMRERERGDFTGVDDFSSRVSEMLADYAITAVQLWGMGLTATSSVFRGIAASGTFDSGRNGREIEFVWDAEEDEFMLWREL